MQFKSGQYSKKQVKLLAQLRESIWIIKCWEWFFNIASCFSLRVWWLINFSPKNVLADLAFIEIVIDLSLWIHGRVCKGLHWRGYSIRAYLVTIAFISLVISACRDSKQKTHHIFWIHQCLFPDMEKGTTQGCGNIWLLLLFNRVLFKLGSRTYMFCRICGHLALCVALIFIRWEVYARGEM